MQKFLINWFLQEKMLRFDLGQDNKLIRNSMTITIDQHVKLELTAKKHAAGLYEAIDNNRKHLSRFLSWIGSMQSVEDLSTYLRSCEVLYQEGRELSFVILMDNVPVGRIGLHYVNQLNKNAAIGYWITENVQGRGIVTRSCRALIDYGFKELGLRRIEIKAATENLKSRAIPVKLGFQQEGILRQAERINGKFMDLVLFSLLNDDPQVGF